MRVVELEGAIGPASADYFIRALEDADEDGVELVVLRLDTPGGLDKSMRDMIKAILASPVPLATYVAPNGSRAASAGTYNHVREPRRRDGARDQHRLVDAGQPRRRRFAAAVADRAAAAERRG